MDGGKSFHTLNVSSIFTSPYSRKLQTLYLRPDMYIRCRTKAVDDSGTDGYWRESEKVRLSETKYGCYNTEDTERTTMKAALSSYESYKASDQVCK